MFPVIEHTNNGKKLQDQERIDRDGNSETLLRYGDYEVDDAGRTPARNYLEWPIWKTINKLRVEVGRPKENQAKWGLMI